jgi:hypothetical protein
MAGTRVWESFLATVWVALFLSVVPGAHAAEVDGEAREKALGLYFERCGVEEGSSRQDFARADWESLVAAGRSGADLLEAARGIPEDCEFVSFKQAVRGVERLRAGQNPFAPERSEGGEAVVRARDFSRLDGELGTQPPFLGLPKRYHAAWGFGAVNAGLAMAGVVEVVVCASSAVRTDDWATQMVLGLFMLPGLAVAVICTPLAIVTAAHVESHRVQDPAVEALGRGGHHVWVLPHPGGLVVRF